MADDVKAGQAAEKKEVKTAVKKKPVAKKKAVAKTTKPAAKKVKKSAAKQKPDKNKEAAASEAEDEEDVEIIEDEEEEEAVEAVYSPKQKPKLSNTKKQLLGERRRRKNQQPTFRRQEWFRYKRLGDSYRKPRGLQSKMRKNLKYRSPMARIGYGTNKEVRGLHPSGFEEVLVYNPKDLEGLDPKKQAARIGHQVGTRKRIAIEDKADELGIRILNRGSA